MREKNLPLEGYWHKRTCLEMLRARKGIKYTIEITYLRMFFENFIENNDLTYLTSTGTLSDIKYIDHFIKNGRLEFGLLQIRKLYEFFFYDQLKKDYYSAVLDGKKQRNPDDLFAEYFFKDFEDWKNLRNKYVTWDAFKKILPIKTLHKHFAHLTFSNKIRWTMIDDISKALINLYRLFSRYSNGMFIDEFNIFDHKKALSNSIFNFNDNVYEEEFIIKIGHLRKNWD